MSRASLYTLRHIKITERDNPVLGIWFTLDIVKTGTLFSVSTINRCLDNIGLLPATLTSLCLATFSDHITHIDIPKQTAPIDYMLFFTVIQIQSSTVQLPLIHSRHKTKLVTSSISCLRRFTEQSFKCFFQLIFDSSLLVITYYFDNKHIRDQLSTTSMTIQTRTISSPTIWGWHLTHIVGSIMVNLPTQTISLSLINFRRSQNHLQEKHVAVPGNRNRKLLYTDCQIRRSI